MSGAADIGLIGLGVMGRNLALNLSDHGFVVAVHNRTAARTAEFIAGSGAGARLLPASSLPELVSLLPPPRRVLLMVWSMPRVRKVSSCLGSLTRAMVSDTLNFCFAN